MLFNKLRASQVSKTPTLCPIAILYMVKCQGFSFGEVSKSSHHEQAGCDQPVADAVVYFLFVVAGEFRQRLVHKQSVVAQDHQQNLYESISNVGLLEEQESEASRQLYNAD